MDEPKDGKSLLVRLGTQERSDIEKAASREDRKPSSWLRLLGVGVARGKLKVTKK